MKKPRLEVGTAELLSEYTYEHYYRTGPTMFVPDAISKAFMGRHAHPTGVLAAIESEAPFSGVNDLLVSDSQSGGTWSPETINHGSGPAVGHWILL